MGIKIITGMHLAFDPYSNNYKSPEIWLGADADLIKHSTETRGAGIQTPTHFTPCIQYRHERIYACVLDINSAHVANYI